MKGFAAFAEKELLEQLRTWRILILGAVLLLFGMTSPLLAKMTPDLMKNLSVPGIVITLPKPAAADAWAQFFKNMGQMGLVVLLLVFGTSLPQEISRGTVLIPLSKGLSRVSVILAKYLTQLFVWTAGYALAAAVCCGYTQYLFGRFGIPNLFFALFCFWLFGAFVLALLLCAGAAVPGNYGGLLLAAAVLCILLALGAFPGLQKWNPVSLASQNAAMTAKSTLSPDFAVSVRVTIFAAAVCLLLGGLLFRRKNL